MGWLFERAADTWDPSHADQVVLLVRHDAHVEHVDLCVGASGPARAKLSQRVSCSYLLGVGSVREAVRVQRLRRAPLPPLVSPRHPELLPKWGGLARQMG